MTGLRRAVKELCSRTLEERKSVPGINPNRADVIIAGAAILQTIMEEQGFESVTISNRNLQNGILVDYLMRTHPQKAGSRLSAREESVLQLARFCRFEEKHSRHIAKLALELFDSARAIGCTTPRPYRASCCTMPPCCTTSGSSFPLRTTTRTATI